METYRLLILCACTALNTFLVQSQPAENENNIPMLDNQMDGSRRHAPTENPIRHALASQPGVWLGRLHNRQDIDALRQSLSQDWGQSPSSTRECFVEIKVTQKVPGHCTRLGRGRLPACQAQDLISMDYENCDEEK